MPTAVHVSTAHALCMPKPYLKGGRCAHGGRAVPIQALGLVLHLHAEGALHWRLLSRPGSAGCAGAAGGLRVSSLLRLGWSAQLAAEML